jgi:hypothetical protein
MCLRVGVAVSGAVFISTTAADAGPLAAVAVYNLA